MDSTNDDIINRLAASTGETPDCIKTFLADSMDGYISRVWVDEANAMDKAIEAQKDRHPLCGETIMPRSEPCRNIGNRRSGIVIGYLPAPLVSVLRNRLVIQQPQLAEAKPQPNIPPKQPTKNRAQRRAEARKK